MKGKKNRRSNKGYYYLAVVVFMLLFSLAFAYFYNYRIEYSVVFVPVLKQNGIIYANETDLQYWVYTNYTAKEGYFSKWTALNVSESWVPSMFYEKIGVGNVTRIKSFYNVFGILIGQSLEFWY